MEYIKQFDRWNLAKQKINGIVENFHIRPGEIRWACMGVNIGSEIDGKGGSFSRPVLILHTIGKSLSLIIPLSSKIKPNSAYIKIKIKDSVVSACLHQIKVISNKRILARFHKIPSNRVKEIKDNIKKYYSL